MAFQSGKNVPLHCYFIVALLIPAANNLYPSTTPAITNNTTHFNQESCLALGGRVGLESAKLSTLLFIPTIGDIFAEKIKDYLSKQTELSQHRLTDALEDIHGIGPKRSEAIARYITTGKGCIGKLNLESD